MSEYIGSRISLISKRDIRYVGILHEINSENSTVALEQVRSYGTEGRSEEEVPPSDNVYEYIVFRGSDVKDLRIEKEPEKKTQPPQIPDDPAILGNARPPGPPSVPSHSQQQSPQQSFGQQAGRGQLPRFAQHSPYPYGGYPPPPNQRLGPYGAPQGYPPQGYPGMQYGPPPGWYPPPGQGFPHGPPGPIPPHLQQGFPGQPPHPPGPLSKSVTPAQDGVDSISVPTEQPTAIEKPAAAVKLPTSTEANAQGAQNGPPPPTESKPDVAAALAPPTAPVAQDAAKTKSAPTAQKSGHIQPAIPMKSPIVKQKLPVNGTVQSYATTTSATAPVTNAEASNTPARSGAPAQVATKTLADANRDARAAVAAAMAKLPPAAAQTRKPAQEEHAVDNLTKKVNEMRTQDNARNTRQPGIGGYGGGRGSRGGYRGGRPRTESQTKKMEVPKTDYDFESANAKFNKQDLVKEAIASGDPVSSPLGGTPDELYGGSQRESESLNQPAVTSYNKSSSFFDNISSESKDREESSSKKLGGREFRSEEQKKNLETFGQGSVDSYRGNYRGRGRGRGYRGRGGYGRSRGGMRARGGIVAAES